MSGLLVYSTLSLVGAALSSSHPFFPVDGFVVRIDVCCTDVRPRYLVLHCVYIHSSLIALGVPNTVPCIQISTQQVVVTFFSFNKDSTNFSTSSRFVWGLMYAPFTLSPFSISAVIDCMIPLLPGSFGTSPSNSAGRFVNDSPSSCILLSSLISRRGVRLAFVAGCFSAGVLAPPSWLASWLARCFSKSMFSSGNSSSLFYQSACCIWMGSRFTSSLAKSLAAGLTHDTT